MYLTAVDNAFGMEIDSLHTSARNTWSDRTPRSGCRSDALRSRWNKTRSARTARANFDRAGVAERLGIIVGDAPDAVSAASMMVSRLTNAFSKKIENYAAMVALYFMYYNFGPVHHTLRVTPAME